MKNCYKMGLSNGKQTIMTKVFFGIGAQKAGTSWLDHCLRQHKDIRLPVIKELHFFDEVDLGGTFLKRMFMGSWRGFRTRRIFAKSLAGLLTSKRREWLWVLKLSFLNRTPHNVRTYGSLIAKYSGEITPAYSIVTRSTIKEIYKVFPNAKLIFIMRNPVDREWSHFKMKFLKNRKLSESEIESKFFDFVRQDIERSNYVDILDNWMSSFPKEQLHLCFYEDIRDQPLDFLNGVTSFLEIAPFIEVPVKSRVNKGNQLPLNAEFKRALYEKHKGLIVEMDKRYGHLYPHIKNWKHEMDDLLIAGK